MSKHWAFYAIGTPAPQGSKTKTRYGLRESSPALKPWRDTVTNAALGQGPRLEGPLTAVFIFSLARPKSTPKKVHFQSKLPDLDKMVRAVGDSVTAAGLWTDDAQVFALYAFKGFAGSESSGILPVPGVIVVASELDYQGQPVPVAKLMTDVTQVSIDVWNKYDEAAEKALADPS